MATIYDLENTFKRIEDNLVNEIINDIKTTSPGAVLMKDNITVWKVKQLKALEDFKKRNKKYFSKDEEKRLYGEIELALKSVYRTACTGQQVKILKAIENGLKPKIEPSENEIEMAFNGVNDRKLEALVKEVQGSLYSAETSAVRYAEDKYKQIIFDAEVYYNTGTGNLMNAIDMATKDFLIAGINNVEYKNGRRVNIQSYAEMALRTAEKRAYIQGEARMRDEYGLGLVIVNRRGNACPKCMQFVGKIFNDDVYGNQKIDKKYPLLSTAIANGLYHPNCKDVHTTYFSGITTVRPSLTKDELLEAEKQYALEQEQRLNERQIRKFKRLTEGTIEPNQKEVYRKSLEKWQIKQDRLIKENPQLRRKEWRESTIATVKPTSKLDFLKSFDDFDATEDFVFLNKNDEGVQIFRNQLTKLMNKYEKLPNKKIYLQDAPTAEHASYGFDFKDKNKFQDFTLNSKEFLTKDTILKATEKSLKNGYFVKVPEADFVNYVPTHEFGHYMEMNYFRAYAKAKNVVENEEEYKKFAVVIKNDILSKYKKRAGTEAWKTAVTDLSEYADKNAREFFAEAFADYELNGENAKFYQEIDEITKKFRSNK